MEYLATMGNVFSPDTGVENLAGWVQQPYLKLHFFLSLIVIGFGRQTWEWTQRLTVPKAMCALGLGSIAVVALLTQDYNPFSYFIF